MNYIIFGLLLLASCVYCEDEYMKDDPFGVFITFGTILLISLILTTFCCISDPEPMIRSGKLRRRRN